MYRFRNLIRLINATWNISKFNNTSSAYHRLSATFLAEQIASTETKTIGNIPDQARKKMQWYMAECMWVSTFYANFFYRKLNAHEVKLCLQSGALIALCDFLIDDTHDKIQRAQTLKRPPKDLKPVDSLESFYHHLYYDFRKELRNGRQDIILHHYERMFDAQLKSALQLNPSTSLYEVDNLCRKKCGTGMVFLRAILEEKISKQEEKAWFELGAFVQFCNDTQDFYKDARRGIRSFATIRDDDKKIKKDLWKQWQQVRSSISELQFSPQKKSMSLFTLHAMYVVILTKLDFFVNQCKGQFNAARLLKVEQKQTIMPLWSWFSLTRAIPKITSFR